MSENEKPIEIPESPMDLPSFFVDHTQITGTATSVILTLAQNLPDRNGRARFKYVARIHMSPQHAKQLLALFVHQVERHEKALGTIQLPKPEAK